MSLNFNGFVFGLPRWEFGAKPASASKCLINNEKPKGVVSCRQGDQYATGFASDSSDVGLSSAAIAFKELVVASDYSDSFVLLQLDEGQFWVCAISNGEIEPESDVILDDDEGLEYHITNYIAANQDSNTKVFYSEEFKKNQVLTDWLNNYSASGQVVDGEDLVELIGPYRNSAMIKKIGFSLDAKNTKKVAVVLVLLVVAVILLMPENKKTNRPKTKSSAELKLEQKRKERNLALANRQKNSEAKKNAVEDAVRRELKWLASVHSLSTKSGFLVESISDILSNVDQHVAGWDAKVAQLLVPRNNLEIRAGSQIVITFQRSEGASIDNFISHIKAKGNRYDIDPQANVVSVFYPISDDNFKGAVVELSEFNQAGQGYYNGLSSFQKFCSAWKVKANCLTGVPFVPDRVVGASYKNIEGEIPSTKQLLLPYKNTELQLTGSNIFVLKEFITHVLDRNSNIWLDKFEYSFSTSDWRAVFLLHSQIIDNHAAPYLEESIDE